MQSRFIFLSALVALISLTINDLHAQYNRSSTSYKRDVDTDEQVRIVGLAPFSLLTRTGRINLRGEYAYRSNRSVSVLIGLPVKTHAPGWLTNAITFKDEEGKVSTNTYKGFVFNAGHRFYFGGKRPAGGFYLEPYVRYNRFTVTHTTTNTGSTGATIVKGSIGGPGLGAAMGVQWRITDAVSLDFTFAGADMRVLTGRLRYESTDPMNDINAFRDKVQDTIGDIPIVGDKLAAQLDGDNSVGVKIPGVTLPGFRCNLTVGVAF